MIPLLNIVFTDPYCSFFKYSYLFILAVSFPVKLDTAAKIFIWTIRK